MSAPSGAATLLATADIARQAGDADLAQKTLEEARELFPESVEVHFALGQSYLSQDNMEAANSAFARVVALDPNHVKGWINYGATCGELDRSEDADRALAKALALDPGSRDAASNLGVLRREMGKLDEAEDLCRRVISIDPSFVFGYYNLAHCLFLAGRFAESAEHYRAGLKRDPDKTPNQNARLAWALLANGDEKAARRELKRAMERLPEEERPGFREEVDEVLTALEVVLVNGSLSIGKVRRQIDVWVRSLPT